MLGRARKFLGLLLVTASLCGCALADKIEDDEINYDSLVTAVKLSASGLKVKSGDSEYLRLSLTPAEHQGKCHVRWEYDQSMIAVQGDNFGAVISGVSGGSTYIKASCNGIVATCMVTVEADGKEITTDPYIYSNFSVIELQPGNTTTISSALYGGSVADMEFFDWKIKDSSVADIAFSRNNCVITAKKTGSTQVVCSHPDAKYDYSFVVYVYTDRMTEPYITTDFNIVTINKNDTTHKGITVDLVNPISAAYKNGFTWNYADQESREIIALSANLNEASVTPLKNGTAKITVTHENAQWPLDIIIRVNTIVKNTYIDLSQSTVVVEGSETPYTVNAQVRNYDGIADNSKFTWDFPENASDLMDWAVSENSLRIVGKKNGVVKVKVSHELSEYSRNLLVILQNQIGSAVDASMYITTTQNFVQTQVGKDATDITVTLVGGTEGQDDQGGEDTNFSWWIAGGRNNGIVEVQQVTGSVRDLNSRSAAGGASSGDFCSATLRISPLREGNARIIVTHPRCLYETEISVKVYSATALVNPLTITTDDSLIKLVNGSETTVSARLRNAKEGDENNIEWSSADPARVSVAPDRGMTTKVSACGSGNGQTYITAHLEGALADKKILVLTADTQQALDTMKYIIADSTYLRVTSGETKEVTVELGGNYGNSDIVSWTTEDSSKATVESVPESANRCTARVRGIASPASGTVEKTKVTASLEGCEPVTFEVTVLPVGESSEIFDESAGYLTTNRNAVVLENVGDSTNLSVSGVNISAEDMRLRTTWTMSDVNAVQGEPVFELAGSPGDNVTLTAKKKGKSSISVKNKSSMNQLSINAKCGEIYEWTDDYIVYITSESDVVNIISGETRTIGCALVNTTSTGYFSWQVTQGGENIDITGLSGGTCTITAKQAGQSIITVSNSLAGEITKEILVNVANTEEELRGFKYLTTEQNVITVGEQSNRSVSVSVMNADTNILTGFSWRSTNESVATVVGSGSVAVVYGKSLGTAKIIVENNDYCSYPLEIICNVVDPVAVSEDPYISCNNIVTCTVGADPAAIAAELVGGKDFDAQNFSWSIVDKEIAELYASNDTAQVRALKAGVTQVIVTHPRAGVPRTVLVICEPRVVTNCHISVPESIIKMAPNDEARTLSATLINGEAGDEYDFKWWADSYDKIDMDYSGSQCIVTPYSSGTVTIHVSHPKAKNQKDIILYISNYTDFAFSQQSIELVTGSSTFVSMEVPATGVECNVAYSSSDNSVCTAFGNTSVCTLSPGAVAPGTSKTCVVTAVLQTKGGVKQAEAQILVSVTGKVETDPYIALSPDNLSTIITMNKGEKRNLKAQVYGNVVDDGFAGLRWSLNKDSENLLRFVGDKTTGSNVQLEAVRSGKAVITVSHGEAKNPLTLYVIVAGEDDPTITLSHTDLSLYIGEDIKVTAKVLNDRGEEIHWEFLNDDKPDETMEIFAHSEKGTVCSISPVKVGNATIAAWLDSGSRAECKVHVLEPEKISLFVYDDEGDYDIDGSGVITEDRRTKYYLSTLQVTPGEARAIHYEAVPAKDKVKQLYRSDASYYEVADKGYAKTWTDTSKNRTYIYPDGVGTIVLTGKTNEGTASLRITSQSEKQASVSVTNSFGYLFTTSKSIISALPEEVMDDPDQKILCVDYEVRPACSKIYVTNLTQTLAGANLSTLDGKPASGNQWIVTEHEGKDAASGIARGTLRFRITGEVNCTLKIVARNENIISYGTNAQTYKEFGATTLKLQVFYAKHTFTPQISQMAPSYIVGDAEYVNKNYDGICFANSDAGNITRYSKFDESSNTFFLGDGETVDGVIGCNEKHVGSTNIITGISFERSGTSGKDDGKGTTQKELVGASRSRTAANGFSLAHSLDYGIITVNNKASESYIYRGRGIDAGSNNDNVEKKNETIRETAFAGYLKVSYFNFEKGDTSGVYRFPVYVLVRNCSCLGPDKEYWWYKTSN